MFVVIVAAVVIVDAGIVVVCCFVGEHADVNEDERPLRIIGEKQQDRQVPNATHISHTHTLTYTHKEHFKLSLP